MSLTNFKVCQKCKHALPVSEFRKHHAVCRVCYNTKRRLDRLPLRDELNSKSREWRARNRGKVKKYNKAYTDRLTQETKRRYINRNKEKKYGLPSGWIDDQLKRQKNKCACCNLKFKGVLDTHLHHSHSLKHAVHLLCCNCNISEGHMKTPERAYRLWQYMLGNELFYA